MMRRYKIEMENGIYTLDADDFTVGDQLHLTKGEMEHRETVAIFQTSRLVALTDVTDEAVEEEEGEIIGAISIVSLELRFKQLVNRLKAEGSIPLDWKPEDEG